MIIKRKAMIKSLINMVLQAMWLISYSILPETWHKEYISQKRKRKGRFVMHEDKNDFS